MTGSEKAKSYQKKRNWLTLAHLLLTLILLIFLVNSNLPDLFLSISEITSSRSPAAFIFFTILSLFFLVFQLPLTYYSSYYLEKEYNLSNHTLKSWLTDTVKKEFLSFALSAAMVLLLYEIIWRFPEIWWFWVWLAYALISYVLGKIFPIFIIPLFYQYKPLEEGELKSRILALAERFRMKVENIYSLNLSKTTKKANAAFCGIGKTKRIILGDTLLSNFTNPEIEVVLAHELGHFKNKDVMKQLIFGFMFSLLLFWFAFHALRSFEPLFGREGIGDLRQLPLLFLIFFLVSLVTSPLGNLYSRMIEKKADFFALKATNNKDAFISCMRKLGEINLADTDPHPLIEFFLYDHPAIRKRIQFAEQF